jgi:hypothetical protein
MNKEFGTTAFWNKRFAITTLMNKKFSIAAVINRSLYWIGPGSLYIQTTQGIKYQTATGETAPKLQKKQQNIVFKHPLALMYLLYSYFCLECN